jgi:hypothetical protein
LALAFSAAAPFALAGTQAAVLTGSGLGGTWVVLAAGPFAPAACRSFAIRAGAVSSWHVFTSLGCKFRRTAAAALPPAPPASAAHFKCAALDPQCFSGHQGLTDNASRGAEYSTVSLTRNLHEIGRRFLVEMLEIAQSNGFQLFHGEEELPIGRNPLGGETTDGGISGNESELFGSRHGNPIKMF